MSNILKQEIAESSYKCMVYDGDNMPIAYCYTSLAAAAIVSAIGNSNWTVKWRRWILWDSNDYKDINSIDKMADLIHERLCKSKKEVEDAKRNQK